MINSNLVFVIIIGIVAGLIAGWISRVGKLFYDFYEDFGIAKCWLILLEILTHAFLFLFLIIFLLLIF